MNRRGFICGLGGGAVLAPRNPVPPVGSGSAASYPVTITITGKMLADALIHQLDYGSVRGRESAKKTIAAVCEIAIRK